MGKDQDLIQAVKTNDVGSVRKILGKISSSKSKKVTKKLNVNIQDEDGFTALHHAALMGNTDVTMALLDIRECNVNARDKKGMSPLHLASWAGKTEIAKLLVDARACVNTCADSGDTPLHLACQHCNAGVVEILLDSNADCTVVNKNGESALDLACRFGHVQVVEMLIKSKDCHKLLALFEENPKTADPPLHIACKTGREEIVVMLLDAGADVNQRGTNGTALHEASLYGKTDVVRILLDNEADVSITNEEGYIPLDVVMQFTSSRASQDIKDLLREASKSKVILAKAVHDYRNMYDPTCLSFKIGDVIEILEQHETGRWKGKTMIGSREIVGYFPSTLVKMSNPRKPSGKTLSMKDAGILPIGKSEMVALPAGSGPASPAHGNRPRMSSFGKPKHGSPPSPPPSSPEKEPTKHAEHPSPSNPITNGIKQNRLFQKNQEYLKYVEVSVESPTSPTSPISPGSRPTQYAEVVLRGPYTTSDNPPLPQKNYKAEIGNMENGNEEEDDIWIKNSPGQPEFPQVRPLTPDLGPPMKVNTEISSEVESSTETTVEANANSKKHERKLKDWEKDVELELKKGKEDSQQKEQIELSTPAQEKFHSNNPVENNAESVKPNYEDMTLNSPDKEEALFKRHVRKEHYSPRKLEHRELESSPGLTRRQLLSYENVELKPRKKDDIQSMLITDVDVDEYVQVNRRVSPVPQETTPSTHSYENVAKDFESEVAAKEKMESQSYEYMNHDDDNIQKYETMKRGVSLEDLTSTDNRALTKSDSYENIDITPSKNTSNPGDYMSMNEGAPDGPAHGYINIKIPPVMPVGIAPSHPEPPTGLTMSEYNSLYDWLENCKLAIYIDNFVKGGFDMISITGLTPEDLTAINITKTGHRKKLLSDSTKQKLSDDVFPRQRPEDIMTWLRLIHLDQYTPQLMDNGFDDMDFVKDITIEDLESIGITKPGHQRKLWLAVSALNSAKDSTMTSIRKTNEKENHSTQVERYLETDLDMVEETKIQQEREVVNTDIDSALSRLPADGASDVGFADEEGTTLVRIPKSGMPLTKQIDDNAVASLHIESLDEARGSTPDLDAILDSLDDETKPFQIPSRGLTFPPDLNTQDVSEVSPPVDTGSNDRTSAEIPCGSSQPREHDKKSIESANNAHACHNSVENKTAGFNSCGKSSDERLRGVSFDSSRKAPPPPPVKPKSIRRPPPKIAPKPSVPQVKAKTTEPDTTEHQGENEKIENLQDQIKEVFRRSRENLVDTEDSAATPSKQEESVVAKVDVTDDELERDQQYTEDLMKDINSMLSDFSTEIDCMFDKTDEKSTTV